MRVARERPGWARREGRSGLARASGIAGFTLVCVVAGLVATISTRGAEDGLAPPGKEVAGTYSHFVYCPIIQKNSPMPDLRTSDKTAAWQAGDSQVVLAYTIRLTNTGSLTATHVRLTDTLPVSTTYVPGSVMPASECAYAAAQRQVTCSGLTVGISQTTAVAFQVGMDRDASCLVENTALVEDGFHPPFTLTAPVTLTWPLPRVMNGGFESGGLTCWQSGGGLPAEAVPGVWKNRPCLAGQHCARLGGDDDTFPHIVPPDTYGAIWQAIKVPPASEVPNPEITLHYRVFSHDRVYDSANDRYYDDFEVSIDRAPGQITNSERDSRGCNVCDPYPAAVTVPVTGAGLVLCGGNRTCARPLTDDPYDTGWLSVTLQLDAASLGGQEITLYLANWNRRLEYWNTWTYVDNISANW